MTEEEARRQVLERYGSAGEMERNWTASYLSRARYHPAVRTETLNLQDYVAIKAPGRYRVTVTLGVRRGEEINVVKSKPIEFTVTAAKTTEKQGKQE